MLLLPPTLNTEDATKIRWTFEVLRKNNLLSERHGVPCGRETTPRGEEEQTKHRRGGKGEEGFSCWDSFSPASHPICCCGAGEESGAKKRRKNMYHEKRNNTSGTVRKKMDFKGKMDSRGKQGCS